LQRGNHLFVCGPSGNSASEGFHVLLVHCRIEPDISLYFASGLCIAPRSGVLHKINLAGCKSQFPLILGQERVGRDV